MIEIRPAQPADLDDLAALGLAAWIKGIGPLVAPDVRTRMESENPFLPFLQDMGERVLVAVIDGQAAGIGACERANRKISDIWVAPFFEGQGAGRALIRALEKQIAAAGFDEAEIEVAAANDRALSLYQHLGYQTVWRSSKYEAVLNTDLDKIGLRKSLREAFIEADNTYN